MYLLQKILTFSVATCAIFFTSLSKGEVTRAPQDKPIRWSEIGAKAGAGYQGDGLSIASTDQGAALRCDFQKLEGQATTEGLWLTSTTDAGDDRFRVIASAVSCGEPHILSPAGRIEVQSGRVRFIRSGLVEEYMVSVDGVRQDFVVSKKPEGSGDLRVNLAVEGARVEQAHFGARLRLNQSDRKIAYSRLQVVDATGRELPATIEIAAANRMSVIVNDAEAVYPVRIDPTFSDENWISMGGIPDANSYISAVVADGSGNLYIGGGFTVAGEILAKNIAKWNGSSWSALGSGVDSAVAALAVSGSDLYVGGYFNTAGGVSASRIAKWNGSSWSALGLGMVGSYVDAIAISGSDVYAGGDFMMAFNGDGSSISANRVARWNGSTWSALGSGVNNTVRALAVVDGDLYAAGDFSTAGGISASRIAKWDGSAWSSLGSGLNGGVWALTVAGNQLYAGGLFTTAGGLTVNYIAKWNGSSWSALGSGMNSAVYAMVMMGSDLCAGGSFSSAGGVSVGGVARWNGTSWSALGTGTIPGFMGSLSGLAVYGGHLFAASGTLSSSGGEANRLVKWNGTNWSPVGSGTDGNVLALAVSGSDLYAGGNFTMIGGVPANRIAKWNGSAWSALGSGMNAPVYALAISGSDLFIGGTFTTAGGVSANRVARWNGISWFGLGSGMSDNVYALAVSGGTLYAGGWFNTAGGITANKIAKWNGSSWSALGTGMNSYGVYSLAIIGPDLYAGGSFSTAGGVSANGIAKWNGSAWSTLGSGVGGAVNAMAVSGTELYVGGEFTTAGGAAANYVAKWSGSTWSPLGSGLAGFAGGAGSTRVNALLISGTNLFVGGTFTFAGGSSARLIAAWNGTSWSALGSGVTGSSSPTVDALAVLDGHLFVGGNFTIAGGKISGRIAKVDMVNDAPTEIALSSSAIAENQAIGTSIGMLSATDPDAGSTHTFALVSGIGSNDNGSFTIQSNILKTAAVFDYETKNSYTIRVRATDSGGMFFEKQFTITVSNTNEAAVEMALSNSSIPENQSSGTITAILSVTDPDVGDSHTFALVSGIGSADNGSFTIHSNILKTAVVFDYETKNSYTIRIRATDGGGLFFEKQFTITVSNGNEAPMDVALSNSSIPENQPTGTTIGILSAPDPDVGDTHTFALVSGIGSTDNSFFTIQANMLKAAAAFDYETKNSYSIRVRVTDTGGLFLEKQFAVEIIGPIVILTHPVSQSVAVGGPAAFVVAVSGSQPGYQWRKNGTVIPGFSGSMLTFSSVQNTDAARYDVVVGNQLGNVVSSNAWLFAAGAETSLPTISITSPKANERITNNFNINLSGTAKDTGLGVAQVWYRLNASAFRLANGTTNWSAPITPAVGTNIIEIKAVDFAGNESIVHKRTFFEVIFSPFTLATNGLGAVISTPSLLGTPTNGAILEVGRSYKIQAIPGLDHVFSNWTGTITSSQNPLWFEMKSNLLLQANFISNPFIPAAGSYNGLFSEAEPIGVRNESAGFLSVKVNTNFTFTSKVAVDGDSFTVGGKFNVDGTVTKTFPRTTRGKSPLTLFMDLNFGSGDGVLTGSISDGVWAADLRADKALYSKTNNTPAQYVGRYTMAFPAGTNAAVEPGGYGYGLVAIDTNGFVNLEPSHVGDGQGINQRVPISKDGKWPLFKPLYGSKDQVVTNIVKGLEVIKTNLEYKGLLHGWVTFATNAPDTNMAPSGVLTWIKTGWTNIHYPGGFTNKFLLSGSRYIAPPSTNRLLAITNGTLTTADGNLTAPFTNQFFLKTNNVVTMLTTNNRAKISFTAKTGFLQGDFRHPDNTNALTKFKGTVLQNDNVGYGMFLGTNQSGGVMVE